MDQQLISSGLNDRNIETYLGIVEQRLDYLIQVFISIVLIYYIYLLLYLIVFIIRCQKLL